ncbi:MAG: DedA family protein/thiosulfate sulfurtransferase GlpE [Phycisphaerae bacterium]
MNNERTPQRMIINKRLKVVRMDQIVYFLIAHGIIVVFAAVFLSQIGLPLPAIPWLLGAGAVAESGRLSFSLSLVAVILACVVADVVWFYLGRYRGNQVLRVLCRVSLEPDSCVRRTQNVFTKYGLRSLLVAKFVLGMNTVAPPLAGLTGIGIRPFLLFDTLGALLYGGCWLGTGYLFHHQISQIAAKIGHVGSDAMLVLLCLAALYISLKYWQRRRLMRELRLARITVAELRSTLNDQEPPLIIVLQTPTELKNNPIVIQGAIHLSANKVATYLANLPRDREIVICCSCPNEVASARMALRLRRQGFRRVRPLLGGIDAWHGSY